MEAVKDPEEPHVDQAELLRDMMLHPKDAGDEVLTTEDYVAV